MKKIIYELVMKNVNLSLTHTCQIQKNESANEISL